MTRVAFFFASLASFMVYVMLAVSFLSVDLALAILASAIFLSEAIMMAVAFFVEALASTTSLSLGHLFLILVKSALAYFKAVKSFFLFSS
jgi:hypothetical protein